MGKNKKSKQGESVPSKHTLIFQTDFDWKYSLHPKCFQGEKNVKLLQLKSKWDRVTNNMLFMSTCNGFTTIIFKMFVLSAISPLNITANT